MANKGIICNVCECRHHENECQCELNEVKISCECDDCTCCANFEER